MKTKSEKQRPVLLELYFHIPFCVKKCAYCDFLSAESDSNTKCRYMSCLVEDLEQFPGKERYLVTSVFLGGGTPTTVDADAICRLLERVCALFVLADDAEITMEANPGTVTKDALCKYRASGINRISFGLQSTHEEELKLLGRIHSYDDFLESYKLAREAGFTNINADLMFGLPGQSRESFRETLDRVCTLGVEHISAYSLIIEEGTPFFSRYCEDMEQRERGEVPKFLPSEEEEEAMYMEALTFLATCGYAQYEISNFAKEGFSCRHNEGYWTGTQYAGFGLGAASYIEKERYTKTDCMEEYLAGDFSKRECHILSEKEQMEEYMILGLRMKRGISTEEFRRRFGREFPEHYRRILDTYVDKGLLNENRGSFAFTGKGMWLSNLVLSEFLDD